MNKEKILMIICLVLFLAGVTALVLNFIYTETNLFLMIALGCIGVANILLFISNIITRKKEKKIK